MAYLNANIPATYAQITKRNYLYDLKKFITEKFEDCIIFGFSSMGGRAILFHAIMENGAIFYGELPIISIYVNADLKPGVKELPLDELELCGIVLVTILSVTHLVYEIAGCTMQYTSRRKDKTYQGKYLFTIDWCAPRL